MGFGNAPSERSPTNCNLTMYSAGGTFLGVESSCISGFYCFVKWEEKSRYVLCFWNWIVLAKMALSCSKKSCKRGITLKSGLRCPFGVEWKSCIHTMPKKCFYQEIKKYQWR